MMLLRNLLIKLKSGNSRVNTLDNLLRNNHRIDMLQEIKVEEG